MSYNACVNCHRPISGDAPTMPFILFDQVLFTCSESCLNSLNADLAAVMTTRSAPVAAGSKKPPGCDRATSAIATIADVANARHGTSLPVVSTGRIYQFS